MERGRDSERYWCYSCERLVEMTEFGSFVCSICDRGFVEDRESIRTDHHRQELVSYHRQPHVGDIDVAWELDENYPNSYGTPPAQIESVKAMPSTIDKKPILCTICLEDLKVGAEAREMQCKHMFHSHCIEPWLEVHLTCPNCRKQLPLDKSKLDKEREASTGSMGNANGRGEDSDRRRFSVSRQWPSSLFQSMSGSSTGNLNSSSTASTSTSWQVSSSTLSRRPSRSGSSTGNLSSSSTASTSTSSSSGSEASWRARRSEEYVIRKEKN